MFHGFSAEARLPVVTFVAWRGRNFCRWHCCTGLFSRSRVPYCIAGWAMLHCQTGRLGALFGALCRPEWLVAWQGGGFQGVACWCVFRVFQPDGRFGSGREDFGRYVSAVMHARRGMACRGRVHVCRGVFRLSGGVGGALLRPAPPCGQPVAAVACAIWRCTVPCPARPGFPRPAVRGIALSWLLRMLRA